MFCTRCENEVEVKRIKVKEELVIHSVKLEIEQESYYCEECGEIVFDTILDEANAKKVREEYCDITGIITSEQIREEILDKYGIGASALGKLLGWGESTIQRYIDGAIPKVEYGKELGKLINPLSMEELLYKNNEKISEGVGRKVARKLIDAYKCRESEFKLVDARDLVKYFVCKCDDMDEIASTKAWCLKIISICQYLHLTYFKLPLYSEGIYAWQYGPVVREVYFDMNKWERNIPTSEFIEESKDVRLDINPQQTELLEYIFNSYGKYQASLLIDITHDSVWNKYYVENESGNEIPRWDIKQYYDSLREHLDANEINDIDTIAQFQVEKILNRRRFK